MSALRRDAFAKDYAAPLKKHKTAVDAQQAADVAGRNAKTAWRVAYDGLAGSLRARFPGRKSYQESFFCPETRSRAAKPAAEPVTTTA